MHPRIKALMLPYQNRWLADSSALKIWLASRQIGKSFALSMEAVMLALESRSNNMILSSSERQSNEVMQKVYSHLRYLKASSGGVIAAGSANREEIALENGSRIISLPANPDTVRGFSGNVFLDEFAFHREGHAIWRAMFPAVTRGFKVRVTSTPGGLQNMFHQLWAADGGNGFSRHRTTIHEAASAGLAVDVAALRAGIVDPEAWAQEFECAFVDRSTAWLTLDQIASCESTSASLGLAAPLPPGSRAFLGVDVGHKRDLTVFWLVEAVGDVAWTRAVRVLRGAPFSEQEAVLDGLLSHPGVRRACIDATGIGAQFAENARERHGSRVEPVVFTQAVKEDLAVTLRRAFEDKRVRVPSAPEVRRDLHALMRSGTSSGHARFESSRSEAHGHADRFWALALALHAASGEPDAPSYEGMAPARGSLRTAGRQRPGCW